MASALLPLDRVEAQDSLDDVFLDEGDADFDTMPIPPTDKSAAEIEVPQQAPVSSPAAAQVFDELEEPHTDDAGFPAVGQEEEVAPAPAPKPVKKAVKKKTPKPKRKKASISNSPGRFMVTISDCPMLREPGAEGELMLTVRSSRKIWTEEVDPSWVRAYNKSGEAGYLSRDCF